MRKLKNRRGNVVKRAFTLIEIMVASVIMVILVGLVIQITSEVLKIWNRSSGKLSANAEARIAMDLITQDLETAVFRNNGKQWLRVKAPNPIEGGFTNQTVALKLFSPALDRDQSMSGDVCAIGYELSYGPSYGESEDEVYALYRQVIDPETTFSELMGASSEEKQNSLTDGQWTTIVDDQKFNYLAGNIMEFKVLLYVDDGTGTAKLINGSEANQQVETSVYLGGVGAGFEEITDELLYADIVLTVISDQGMEMLQNVSLTGKSVDEIVVEHGNTFIRRVNFMATPL